MHVLVWKYDIIIIVIFLSNSNPLLQVLSASNNVIEHVYCCLPDLR